MAAEIERHAGGLHASSTQQIAAQERQSQTLAAESRQAHEQLSARAAAARSASEERHGQVRDNSMPSVAAELAADRGRARPRRAACWPSRERSCRRSKAPRRAGSPADRERRSAATSWNSSGSVPVARPTPPRSKSSRASNGCRTCGPEEPVRTRPAGARSHAGRQPLTTGSRSPSGCGRPSASIWRAESEVAELYLRKERFAAEAGQPRRAARALGARRRLSSAQEPSGPARDSQAGDASCTPRS